MTTINSNGGLFNVQNSTNIPLNVGQIFEGLYSSTLNYSTIEVSVKCDTFYSISIIYSPDSNNDEYSEIQEIEEVIANTSFYKFEPKMRYFKIRIENIDTEDQELLSVNCIQKSSFVYSSLGGGSSGDVTIVSPLIGDSVSVNLNAINSDFIDAGNNDGLKVAIQNTEIAVTNASLSDMTFTDEQLNVSDATTHTTLDNIYNVVNSRGSGVFTTENMGAASITNVINLSNLNVKLLTIYGTVTEATTLTVVFSPNNVIGYYYPSQYSYEIASAGSFGFGINVCPNYICLQTSNALTKLEAFIDYS